MTAFMEELNSPLAVVKRRTSGYTTVEYMAEVLYFCSGEFTLPCYCYI
jgi:hypothetical protein